MSTGTGLSTDAISAIVGVVIGAVLGFFANVLTEWVKRTWFSGRARPFFGTEYDVDFVARMQRSDSIWVRVLVRNDKKKAVARGCRAYLSDIRWRINDGEEVSMPIGDTLPLIWSNTDRSIVIDIPYGINQFVDILAIFGDSPTIVIPQTNPTKFQIPWFDHQEIRFTVTVTTENRAPVDISGSVFKPTGSTWESVKIV